MATDPKGVQRLCRALTAAVHSRSRASQQIPLYSSLSVWALK